MSMKKCFNLATRRGWGSPKCTPTRALNAGANTWLQLLLEIHWAYLTVLCVLKYI